MATVYEWTVETIVDGEIDDCDFSDSLSNLQVSPGQRIGLVKSIGSDAAGVTDTFYAYVIDGKLPEEFEDGGGKVPAKFHKELKAYYEK